MAACVPNSKERRLVLALFATAERIVLDWTVFWCARGAVHRASAAARVQVADAAAACRVPLYYEGKLLFVLWLYHPSTNGAALVYARLLSPLLRQHEPAIDQASSECQALCFDYITNGVRWCAAAATLPPQACALCPVPSVSGASAGRCPSCSRTPTC